MFAVLVGVLSVVLSLGVVVPQVHAAAPSCEITFRLNSNLNALSVTFQAQYTNAPGEFPGEFAVGNGDGLNDICTPFDGNLYAGGDSPDSSPIKALSLVVQNVSSFVDGPTDMMSCTWIPRGRLPVAGDFNIVGTFATLFPLVNFVPTIVQASVSVSDISCSGTITTTTLPTTTTSSTTVLMPTTTMIPETTTTTTLLLPSCGDFNGDGQIFAGDAFDVLRAAVGLLECELCVCDLDNNGLKGVSDALSTLRKAVGQDITLSCLSCDL